MKMINNNSIGNADGWLSSRSLRTHSLQAAVLFLAMLFVGCSLLTVTADETDAETSEYNYSYWKDHDSAGNVIYVVEIGSYKGSVGANVDVIIPSELGGMTVIGISDNAFKDKTLKSVTIPNTVTCIKYYAFAGCTLQSVTLPSSLTELGSNVFQNCTSLTTITLPGSIGILGKETFSGCTNLNTVTISDGVTEINENAFAGCTNLTSVNIPSSVTYIHKDAFSSTTFYDVDGVTELAETAEVLKGYTYTGTGSKLIRDDPTALIKDGVKYQLSLKDKTATVVGYTGSVADVTVLSKVTKNDVDYNVTAIDEEVFQESKTLKSVTIENSVITIGKFAFFDCESLTSVVLPDSVESIGEQAFAGCEKLTTVTFGSGVKTLGAYAFYQAADRGVKFYADSGCTIELYDVAELRGYTFKKGSQESKLVIEDPTHLYKGGIKYTLSEGSPNTATVAGCYISGIQDGALTVPSTIEVDNKTYNVTAIGAEAFKDRAALKSVTIDDSVTTIGEKAFSGCTDLASVTIGTGITAYADWGIEFYDAKGTTQLTAVDDIKENTFFKNTAGKFAMAGKITLVYQDTTANKVISGITTVTSETFSNCSKDFISVSIEDGVTSIGDNAFKSCANLASITISDTVTSIGELAFFECTKLTSITIPQSVTVISNAAFQNCSELKTVEIKGQITKFDSNAFNGCVKLESDLITDSVTEIGNYAFNKCEKLTSVTIPGTVTTIGEGAFSGCIELKTVTIEDGVTAIGSWAFDGCDKLETVVVGNSVETLGTEAFSVTFKDAEDRVLTEVGDLKESTFKGGNGVLVKEDASVLNADGIRYRLSTDGTATVIGYTGTATDVTIPSTVSNGTGTYNVIKIGDEAFKGKSLESVTIGDNVTDIGKSAFSGCTSLKSVRIGKNTATIGGSAFYDCPLTYLSVPTSVTTVGDDAFNSVKFYDSDGNEITDLNADYLKGSTFESDGSSGMKRTASADGSDDGGLSTSTIVSIIGILLVILVLIGAYMYYRRMNSTEQ